MSIYCTVGDSPALQSLISRVLQLGLNSSCENQRGAEAEWGGCENELGYDYLPGMRALRRRNGADR